MDNSLICSFEKSIADSLYQMSFEALLYIQYASEEEFKLHLFRKTQSNVLNSLQPLLKVTINCHSNLQTSEIFLMNLIY